MLQTDTTPFVVRSDPPRPRPRVSRETRRLLMTALLAVLALWILARIRFPQRAVNPNPVPPLLTQLAVLPRFSDLASTVQSLRLQLDPLLTSIVPTGGVGLDADQGAIRVPALRIDDDLAVAILDPVLLADGPDPPGIVARDTASGLALVRVDHARPAAIPLVWQPQRLDEPRYLVAASPSPTEVWMRPVFIGAMNEVLTPRWDAPVWAVPRTAGLSPGAIVFTEDAELVGMVAPYDGGVAIVPAREVLRAAEEIRTGPPPRALDVHIEVQPLSPSLATASGTESGVVVTWVDRSAAVAHDLRPGDVIVAINGKPIRTVEEWQVRLARAPAGDAPTIRVVQGGGERDVRLAAVAPVTSPSSASPGFTMRPVAGTGVEIVRVNRGSAAETAGLRSRDLVTAIGAIDAPTPAQVRSAFRAARRGDVLVVAITRGSGHRVVGLQQ